MPSDSRLRSRRSATVSTATASLVPSTSTTARSDCGVSAAIPRSYARRRRASARLRRMRGGARRLERAIEAVGSDDTAATRQELYGALLAGELSIPLPEPLPEGEWQNDELETLEVVLLGSEDGPVLPVFTSEEQLLEWRAGGGADATVESRA